MVARQHARQHVVKRLGNNDDNQTKPRLLAIRHGEEHHLHRYEGLPVGLQILLPRGQERERADALGGGQDLHRLCARP